jgi:Acetyltransferase (GNAT) domain
VTGWNVARFEPADAVEWDALVEASGNGAMLHTRRFLSYHGDRFADRSLTVRDTAGRIAGVFPAAESPADPRTVASHPGATFGGLLAAPDVGGGAYRSMMQCALGVWADMGYTTLAYAPAPFIYHRVPRQDDCYVLGRLGARVSRRTLSACIDLAHRLPQSSRRKRSLAKALKAGCTVRGGADILPQLWPVVESALLERHGRRPVHSLAEIELLASRFPAGIECVGAFAGDEVVAGVVLFASPAVTHVQYSLSSPAGMAAGAMDLLIEHAIQAAADRHVRFFDLGISTDPAGLELNEGLHQFKLEFGAGTVVYEQYELGLDPRA